MIYFGCLPILVIILLVVAVSLLRQVAFTLGQIVVTLWNIVCNFINELWDTLTSPFRPKPMESDIDDPDYFVQTQEQPKRYTKEDGEYTSFKKTDK